MTTSTARDHHPIDRDKLLTSHEAGTLIQVNPSSINKWVEEGRLPAFRTPGGHRRIRASDLAAFLDAYKMPIPDPLVFALKRRILIVDDDHRQLESMARLLRTHSDRIALETTTSGLEALIRIGAFKPHAVVLDVYMPEVDGLEVCRRLKKSSETRAIDILVTSGQLTPALEKKALQAGARACLPKPLDIAAALKALGLGGLSLSA